MYRSVLLCIDLSSPVGLSLVQGQLCGFILLALCIPEYRNKDSRLFALLDLYPTWILQLRSSSFRSDM